jgi:sterol carrier protein 2
MGLEAATKALLDAGITYDDVEHAYVGYVYGDSTCGQAALYNLGLTGIPITNVNNNCSTGSTALFNAANLVRAGAADCALALGFERMRPGSLSSIWTDRPPPGLALGAANARAEKRLGENHGPNAPRMFCNGAQEYFVRYGGGIEHLAKIASKNHRHSVKNPYSQFRDGWSEEQVRAAPQISNNLTKYMCSPTSVCVLPPPCTLHDLTKHMAPRIQDGAACNIVASEAFVRAHGLENQAIEIVAQALATDTPDAFTGDDAMAVVGFGMTQRAADKVFKAAGARRDEVGVVELHDCFAANELIMYPALGLCAMGDAAKMVERGDNTYGGKYVVNPSGGLEAKGHPLGATGLGMHFYIASTFLPVLSLAAPRAHCLRSATSQLGWTAAGAGPVRCSRQAWQVWSCTQCRARRRRRR